MRFASKRRQASEFSSAEVDDLLVAIARDGFTMRYWNGPEDPNLIVGTYHWDDFVDSVVIRGVDQVVTARIPKAAATDVFAPALVVWAYEGEAKHALRALLELPHPEHPNAPATPVPAPRSLHVPAAHQAPVTVRPASALAGRTRRIRLGAALLAHTGEKVRHP